MDRSDESCDKVYGLRADGLGFFPSFGFLSFSVAFRSYGLVVLEPSVFRIMTSQSSFIQRVRDKNSKKHY